MVIILGLLQFIVVTWILLYEYKIKSPAVFLWATLWLMFSVMHLMASFWGDAEYSDSVLSTASLFVILFSVIYYGVRYWFKQQIKRKYSEKLDYNLLKEVEGYNYKKSFTFIFVVFGAAVVARIASYIIYAGGLSNTAWAVLRAYSSDKSYYDVSGILICIFYALGGIVCLGLIKKDKKKFIISSLLMCSNIIIMRNRVEVLPLVCSFITIFILKNKRISLKVGLIGLVSSIIVIYLVYAIRAFRWMGTIGEAINGFSLSDLNTQVVYFLQTDNGELGLRRYFYYFIDKKNNFENFGKFHTYIRMLMVYIPTKLSFGIKPPDFAISMGIASGGTSQSSMHPTLFGDCYANLGFFGLIIGMIWGIVVSTVDKIILRLKNIYFVLMGYIMCASAYVIIGRGAVYNGFVKIAYGIPILFIFEYICEKVKIRRHTFE